ncbi:MAG: hypothetical protein IKX23_04205 [Treponema sp.]|nr:hypothetical protein [Treponema sp.]
MDGKYYKIVIPGLEPGIRVTVSGTAIKVVSNTTITPVFPVKERYSWQ